jgi:pimeloyl-ACP methyl ester carboxylesterase
MPRPGLTPLELVVLGGCGHMPSIEAPQEYRHAVTEFLRG